jgi:GDSL-like Lipase/Acylhydrolase family
VRKLLLVLAGPVLAAFVGMAVALVIGEMAIRIYDRDPLLPLIPPEPYVDNAVLYRRSPTRLYELRPGVDEVVRRERIRIHINAAGLRDDRDLPRAKPPGTFRVVVLGDSFTFGGKVQVDETFTADLERELRRGDPSRTAEVLNFAVPGYNTEQEMLSLKEAGLAYEPDLVIVNFVLNDAAPMQQLVPEKARLPLCVRRVLKKFDLVQFLYAFSKQASFVARQGVFRESENHAELAAGSPGWSRARDSLAEIHRLASQAHAGLLVVVWPMLVDLNRDYPHRAKHDLVVGECRRLGIPVFDLLPSFTGQDASALWASRDDHHPNARALEMGAKAVSQELAAARLVPIR